MYCLIKSQCLLYVGKKMKSSYKNNKFKISTPKWNEKFVLTDESYFVSDFKAYFEYIIKKNMKL